MNKSLQQVAEFHTLFEHPIGTPEGAEPRKIRALRIKLLFEELKELAEAGDVKHTLADLCRSVLHEETAGREWEDGDNVNKIEELDALADIQYVLNGKILTSGLQEVFDKNFELVHANNMQKAHLTRIHAQETLDRQIKVDPQSRIVERKHGPHMFYMVLNGSGKVIKPWNHKKVKLSL